MDVRAHLLALERFAFFVLVAGILVGKIGIGASYMIRPPAVIYTVLDDAGATP